MPNKPEKPEENMGDKLPDRPLECSECKKPISVNYTEIMGQNITHTCMCADCPELKRRLQGLPTPEGTQREGGTGLACGSCGTTLEALRVGNPVGCSVCYKVFEDILVIELQATKKIPSRLLGSKKSQLLHMGRAPGEIQEVSHSMRLLALNEQLNETLQREDYEQAAWLRDQIKELTEAQYKEKKNGK